MVFLTLNLYYTWLSVCIPSLPKELLQMLIKIVSGSWPSLNPQQRKPSQGIHHAVIVLSGSILQDLLLSNTESSFTPTVEPKHQNIASLLAVVFAQVNLEALVCCKNESISDKRDCRSSNNIEQI